VRLLKHEDVQSLVEDVYVEERKAEEALRRSEEKFRNIFESANDCMIFLDVSGRVLEVNKKTLEVYGGSGEELLGKHFTRLGAVSSRDLPRLLNAFASVLTGKKATIDLCIKNKIGKEVYLECLGSITKIDGKLVGVLIVARDVTERRYAEEALRRSEERAKSLVEFQNRVIDTAVVWIDLLDAEGNVTLWNRAAELISGYSREEVVGHKKVWEWLYPDLAYRAKVFAETKKVMEKGKRTEEYHTTIRCKDGTLKTISWHSNNLLDSEGKPAGLLGVGVNITETEKAQEKVGESEEKYRSLFENARDVIVTMDLKGNVTSVNKLVMEYGFQKDAIIGKNMLKFVPKKYWPRLLKDLAKISQGNHVEGEIEINTPKGKKIVEYRSNPIVKDDRVVGLQAVLMNVTERKQTEEALRESEERLKQLIEYAPDAIYINDLKGNFIDGNKQAETLTGYKKEELIGKNMLSVGLLPKRYVPKAAGALMKNLLGQKTGPDVFELVRKDGSRVTVEISTFPVKRGGKTEVIGIARDITERKQMEEDLTRSEEKYRNIVELAPDSIMTFDLKGVITSCNTASTLLSGYSKDEIVGKHFSKLSAMRARDVPKYLKMLPSTLRGKVPKPFEIAYQRRDGTLGLGEVHISLMKERGKTIGLQAIMRDITERKQMEEKIKQYSEHLEELVQKRTAELLESEKRYSILVEEASDGVVMIQDEKTIFANKKALEIAGYSRDEIIDLPLEKLIDEKYLKTVKEGYNQTIRTEIVPSPSEVELITKTGERVQVEGSPALVHYQGRPAVIVIWRDIRERKRMEKERLRLEKLATMGELATMVGHDLRNPLQSIENATYYLNNDLPCIQASQKGKEMLQIINDSVNYADKIIRDLQDFATARAPALKETDINTLVGETLSQVRAPTNVELRTQLGSIPQIKVDRDQIKRVFLNLSTNAIQAMENGGTLTVSTKQANGFVEVSFKDTGVGITKENMQKIFTPFYTTRAKGMGMGLPICKKFVDTHGGIIEVESEVGKGTTFTVKLPIKQQSGGENQ